MHHRRKSDVSPESRHVFLCEPKVNIHSCLRLWKTPVEKTVENVENSDLSTVIPGLFRCASPCGKNAYTAE